MAEKLRPPTPRQKDILRLRAQGLDAAQAAKKLYITYNSAQTHARALYKRVGANGMPHAVARVYVLWPETFEEIPAPRPPGLPALHDLHVKLIARVSSGMSIIEAGAELLMSEEAAKSYMRTARMALGAKSTAQAVYVAHLRGLVRPRFVIR